MRTTPKTPDTHTNVLSRRTLLAMAVMREYVRSYAPIPAIKAIIGQRAGDPAWRTVRPPLVAMDDAAAQELFSAMGVESGVAAD